MLIMPLRTVHVHRNIMHFPIQVFSSLAGRYIFLFAQTALTGRQSSSHNPL